VLKPFDAPLLASDLFDAVCSTRLREAGQVAGMDAMRTLKGGDRIVEQSYCKRVTNVTNRT
jgi:hypothetical protein